MSISKSATHPRDHLIAVGKTFPGAWRQVDLLRQDKGKGLPNWPDWCFMPMAGAYAIVSQGDRLAFDRIADVSRFAALSAWRVTQGVYRYDDTLYQALIDTSISGDLPCDLLYTLPEWCVYIETPGATWIGDNMYGFFAHLEYDVNNHREELRLLIDTEKMLIPVPIHLGSMTLSEAISQSLDEANRQAIYHGHTHDAAMITNVRDDIQSAITVDAEKLLSLLLYLCSETPDIDGNPTRPVPKRTKEGWRLFPAKNVTRWNVGVRIGASLRQAYSANENDDASSDRNRPRAHIRRAHWHTFLTGTGRTLKKVKWLPPIPINISDEALPTTIKPIK